MTDPLVFRRPSAAEPLLILAMDHRESFGRTIFGVEGDAPTGEQQDAMVRAKELIYAGLRLVESSLPAGRAGVLVDERYGQPVIDAAHADPVVLAVPLERSGRPWFELEYGQDWESHLQATNADYAKVLIRDNPTFPRESRERQFESLRNVSRALAKRNTPLLCELLVPATDEQLASVNGDSIRYDREVRPALVTAVIADHQDAQIEPTIWKIEGLETTEAARAVVAQARAGGRDGVDVILLGRDAPAERLYHWIDVAAPIDGYVGFAIGRSIWEDAIRAHHRGELGDFETSRQVSDRYLDFARAYCDATGAAVAH
jgi:myo-inositol catabolism protein IolC